jgi:signal transduction histidine kinase
MIRLTKTLVLGAIFLILPAFAMAADRATADEALAMVKSAIAYMKKHGNEKAFADFADVKNSQWHDRDLYLFVYDFKGINVAHGNNPKMPGKDLLELRDADGKPIIRRFIEVTQAKGSGWVDYMWPNPVTKAIEMKTSYVEKTGDLIVGAGIYKPVSK